MDDEPILDCIIVAARTDRSWTMASSNEHSTPARVDAAEVDAAARGVPDQSQATAASSSSRTVAVPLLRRKPVS